MDIPYWIYTERLKYGTIETYYRRKKMSGANLDGYNYAWKKSTLKSDLEKRVDKLEEGMRELVAVLALMNQTMDQIEGKENAE
jgi:predicted metal-dependent hydrolase